MKSLSARQIQRWHYEGHSTVQLASSSVQFSISCQNDRVHETPRHPSIPQALPHPHQLTNVYWKKETLSYFDNNGYAETAASALYPAHRPFQCGAVRSRRIAA